MLDQPGVSQTFPSSLRLNHPLPWSSQNFRQGTVPKRLAFNIDKDPITSAQNLALQGMKNQGVGTKQLNSSLKSVIPQNYYSSPNRYNSSLLQWPKSELLMPKGISLVTEKRLLARAEALNQRNQTGISASQSLPRINESIALQLHQNNLNGKKIPWARATASEPQLISQNRGGTNVQWRLAAKAPVHYHPGVQSRLTPSLGRAPSKSSTATDFAWYRSSKVSDIWK